MDKVFCTLCNNEVKPEKFGGGWVGICCDKVVFSYSDQPESDFKNPKNEKIPMGIDDREPYLDSLEILRQ